MAFFLTYTSGALSMRDHAWPRFPGMSGPVSTKLGDKPKAKAAVKKSAAAPKRLASDPGARKVSTKKYTQKHIQDVPLCHLREWLDKMDGVYANLEVTKKFSRQDALTMLSFGLGFHPRDPPVESAP